MQDYRCVDNEIPVGPDGELVVRSVHHASMRGYRNDPAATNHTKAVRMFVDQPRRSRGFCALVNNIILRSTSSLRMK